MRLWWWQLARYARPHWRGLLLVMLLMFVGVFLDVLKPWPLKLLVDNVLRGQSLSDAVSWITALPVGASPTAFMGCRIATQPCASG